MNAFGLSFHHLGLAVRNPAEALAFLHGLGYRSGDPLFDPEQNVNLMMCSHGTMPPVEIIYPAAGRTPIDGLLARHADGIVYHPCYVAHDLEHTLAQFETAGVVAVCVAPPKPALLFGGLNVSFYNIVGMGLVEIIESRGDPPAAGAL